MRKPTTNAIFVSLVMFTAMLLAASPSRAQQQSTQTLSTAQIEQLVAPIALYPELVAVASPDGIDLSIGGRRSCPLVA